MPFMNVFSCFSIVKISWVSLMTEIINKVRNSVTNIACLVVRGYNCTAETFCGEKWRTEVNNGQMIYSSVCPLCFPCT